MMLGKRKVRAFRPYVDDLLEEESDPVTDTVANVVRQIIFNVLWRYRYRVHLFKRRMLRR